jgi:hypothetical protein
MGALQSSVMSKLASMGARLDAQSKNFTEYKQLNEAALAKLLATIEKRINDAETAQEYLEELLREKTDYYDGELAASSLRITDFVEHI